MPLDNLNYLSESELEIETCLTRRKQLIEALRDDPRPWDFRYLDRCAMGLAIRLGIAPVARPEIVGPAIGITAETARQIFMSSWNWPYRKRCLRLFTRRAYHTEVTPAMVADELERLA